METQNIKAIIFDWGGVLIEHPAPAMIAHFSASLQVSGEAVTSVANSLVFAFQKGKISEDTFWEELCRSLRVPKPTSPSLWTEAFRNAYQPRPEMFSLASRLKRGYRIGLLSNAEVPAMKFFEQQGYDMFDVAVFSCAEGVCKPERKIYEIALERLKVLPHEAVFIDDRKDFLEGAKQLGIHTILFSNPHQVTTELASFFAVT